MPSLTRRYAQAEGEDWSRYSPILNECCLDNPQIVDNIDSKFLGFRDAESAPAPRPSPLRRLSDDELVEHLNRLADAGEASGLTPELQREIAEAKREAARRVTPLEIVP